MRTESICMHCSDVMAVSSGSEALTRSVQYVNVSVLPFGAWFFTHIHTLLYIKVGEESTISVKEVLPGVKLVVCLCTTNLELGVLHWELEAINLAWMAVNQRVCTL